MPARERPDGRPPPTGEGSQGRHLIPHVHAPRGRPGLGPPDQGHRPRMAGGPDGPRLRFSGTDPAGPSAALRRAHVERACGPAGPADDLPDLDVLVVSAERMPVALTLNDARAAKGLRRLAIRAVPMVLAQDGLPISSRRIRQGLIDRRGRRLKPMQVFVGSGNPVKARAVREVFRALGLPAQVRGVRVPTDVSDQPFDHEAVRGAINRAKADIREGDLGVGIEAGLVWSPVLSDYFDVQYCAVVDRSGRLTVGHGPGFAYPAKVLEKVKAGSTVGEAMDRLTRIRGIGSKQGAIGHLTEGRLDRRRLTEPGG